ncbi:MAG: HAD-IA family hydrolase [Pseudomonadota bacterium]|nr:HAD-IA family hydrolase [Pseudomonadota bacterium]
MSPRLVIFDCDGTLVDSQHMICAAMNQAFADHGLTVPPRETILGIVGLSLPQAIARLVEDMDEERVGAISDSYKQAFGLLRSDPANSEPLYEGALEAVLDLAARDDVLLGIATGKSRRGVDRVLALHGLGDHFITLQTADDNPSKPHPGMIRRAMCEAGARPEHTLMIGDTTYDMAMARSAGVAALGVGWGYHPPAHLLASGAHSVSDDFPALVAAIGELHGASGAGA